MSKVTGNELKPKDLDLLKPYIKPKWVSKVEEKYNVSIEINWFDKLRYDVEKFFKKFLLELLISYLTTKLEGSKMIDWLKGKKTYIVAFLLLLEGVIVEGLINGDWTSGMQRILEALALFGLRAGVAKSSP